MSIMVFFPIGMSVTCACQKEMKHGNFANENKILFPVAHLFLGEGALDLSTCN